MNLTKQSWVLIGTGVGVFFIVFAFFLEAFAGGYAFTVEGLTKTFTENYSLWVVALAPLVLGIAGYYIGKFQSDNRDTTEKLISFEHKRTNSIQKYLNEIASGNLNINITEEKSQGSMFLTIETLQKNLFKAKEDEEKRKIEDNKRNWTTEGLAKFGDILRQQSSNINEFAYLIIKNLVNYIDANQGGFYLINNDIETNPFIELVASCAYDRRKYSNKRIEIGEGLVGTCVIEKETTILTDIPQEYITIKSGLGGSNPNFIVLVPLKIENDVFGVIEFASFFILDKYKIEFLEKIAESIASTIASLKVSLRTEQLLSTAQKQTELMQQQEEEMRQNLEEMHATQEAVARRESEITETMHAFNSCLGIFEMNTMGEIIKTNKMFESYLKNSNLIGKRHDSLAKMNDMEFDFYNLSMNNIINKVPFEANISYKTDNNEIISLHEYFTPLKELNGNVRRILVITYRT